MIATYYQPNYNQEPPAPDFAAVVHGIRSHLPIEDHWQVTETRRHGATLRAEDGAAAGLQLWLHRERKSLRVCQDVQVGPRGSRYFSSYSTPAPSITVSNSATPRSMASSITRRLLPDARRLFAEECALVGAWWAREEARQQTIRLLEEITGRKRTPHSEDTIYLLGGSVRVLAHDSIQIELSGLDLETAADILSQCRR